MSDSTLALPTYDTLRLELEAPVATVTLDRPQVLNALNRQMFDDLEAVFRLLAADPTVRVVVVTGAGQKAFAAGADIKELGGVDAATGEALALRGQAVLAQIATCGKPVVAAIRGFALGGGCELALACTLRIAASDARFGQPEAKLGLLPGYGGTQRLPRLVGAGAALRLILTGDSIAADEALRIGLVDLVVAPEELASHVRQLALRIAAQAPLALGAAIAAVRQGADLPLDRALALEAELFGQLCETHDKTEGVAAFLEKRPARFVAR